MTLTEIKFPQHRLCDINLAISMKFLLFVICICASIVGHAQKVKLGFRAGMSLSNLYSHHSPGEIPDHAFAQVPPGPIISDPEAPSYYYETSFSEDMRTGWFTYFSLQYKLKEKLSAEIGLGYTQRGINIAYDLRSSSVNASNQTETLSYDFKRDLRVDYISIPLTIHYALDRKQRFYAAAGIYNSIAVKFLVKESDVTTNRQTFDSSGNVIFSSGSASISTDGYASLFDSGLIAGIGAQLPVTENLMIGFDLRSALGLVSIPRKYEQYGFQSFSQRSKNIGFESGLTLQYILK